MDDWKILYRPIAVCERDEPYTIRSAAFEPKDLLKWKIQRLILKIKNRVQSFRLVNRINIKKVFSRINILLKTKPTGDE